MNVSCELQKNVYSSAVEVKTLSKSIVDLQCCSLTCFDPLLLGACILKIVMTVQMELVSKNTPANEEAVRDVCSIPGSGRSPGEEMATHFCILAWKIPWTEEPGRL